MLFIFLKSKLKHAWKKTAHSHHVDVRLCVFWQNISFLHELEYVCAVHLFIWFFLNSTMENASHTYIDRCRGGSCLLSWADCKAIYFYCVAFWHWHLGTKIQINHESLLFLVYTLNKVYKWRMKPNRTHCMFISCAFDTLFLMFTHAFFCLFLCMRFHFVGLWHPSCEPKLWRRWTRYTDFAAWWSRWSARTTR